MKTTLILSSFALLFSACKPQETTTSDASAEALAAKPYPLDICVVSGEKLGSMGDPVVILHEGQEIKFCCDSCEPKFRKAPAKFLSKLEDK